jgi:alpha-mannosidase
MTLAKYEVPGHKWIDFSEHGFGVSLLNDCKYGFSTHGNTMRISLLARTKDPDPQADMGHHEFVYAIMPHTGGWREAGVVAEGFRINSPLLWANRQCLASTRSPVSMTRTSCSTPSRKPKIRNDVVVRLYETHNARGIAHVKVDVPFTRAVRCNILEEESEELTVNNGVIKVPYTPFQIIGIKLK